MLLAADGGKKLKLHRPRTKKYKQTNLIFQEENSILSSMETSGPSGVIVTISSKYSPAAGYSILTNNSSQFHNILRDFESGEMSMNETAKSLIRFLFNRDFSSSPTGHWDCQGPRAVLLKKHDSGAESYTCESTAEW